MPPSIEPLEPRRLLAAGDRVTSFDGDGVLILTPPQQADRNSVMAALPDGRFYVASVTIDPGNDNSQIVVTRYLSNGHVDTTFGGTGGQPAGSISPATLGDPFTPVDMGIDGSGRIVIGGSWHKGAGVVRLTPGGTMDVSFGGLAHGMPTNTPAGMAVIDHGFPYADEVADIDVAPDGRVGVVATGFGQGLATVFQTDGSLAFDRVFAPSSQDSVNDEYETGSGQVCTFTSDGRFVVGGQGRHWKLDYFYNYSWLSVGYDRSGSSVSGGDERTSSDDDGGIGAIEFNPGDGSIIVAGENRPLLSSGLTGSFITSPLTTHDDVAALPDGRFYMIDSFGHLVRMTKAGAVDPTFPTVNLPAVYGRSKIELIGNDPLVLTHTKPDDLSFSLEVNIFRIDGSDNPVSPPPPPPPPPPAEQPLVTRNSKGTLAIRGTSEADTILVSMRHRDNRIVVRVNGDQLVQSFPPKPVKRIQIFAGDGDDIVTIAPGVLRKAYIEGADGDDTINSGDGYDILTGGEGNDQLNGGAGNDQISGDGGDDQLFGNGGRDILHGGDGNDALFGGPTNADQIFGDAGNDSAANDVKDLFDSIETKLG